MIKGLTSIALFLLTSVLPKRVYRRWEKHQIHVECFNQNPDVMVQLVGDDGVTQDKLQRMHYRLACTKGLANQIVRCNGCARPAANIDSFFPYHTDHNTCELHSCQEALTLKRTRQYA